MNIPGEQVKRTRIVRTDRFVVVLEVPAVIPDADPTDVCYEPATVELLREVEARAKVGDVAWLQQRGKVYTSLDAA